MRVFYDPIQTSHNPEGMLMRGKRQAFPEAPERLDYFLNGLRSLDLEPEKPGDYSRDIVTAIHDPGYVDFLQSGYEEWSALANASSEIIPNTHPGRHMNTIPAHIVGRAGYYMADQACPIGPQTWLAAKASADCAVAATDSVLAGDAVAFALCRPPGHHAFADLAGGFCYLNNVAIAAQRALDQGAKRVAILDVDVHHGNGTQGIFYDRDDVLFVSLHGDPDIFYPFFCGYAEETGRGSGEGCNLNLPLADGTGDQAFLEALEIGKSKINEFAPDVLLVSLGLDTQADDPLGIFNISLDGFYNMGTSIQGLGLPSVILQEGGYICDLLGENLSRFLAGFMKR